MPRPKKIEVVKVREVDGTEVYVDKRTALLHLMRMKAHSIFDREPAPAFNANLDRLVDEIIALIQ